MAADKNAFSKPIEEVRRELEENGVCVIPKVLTEDECDQYITQYHQWLATVGTGFPDNMGSIIHKYSIAHAEPSWNIRLKAKPLFADLWGTEKLLSSMDAIAIGRPPEDGVTHFEVAGEHTLHLDQGPKKLGLHSYQGAVYLEEAIEDDWCFMVMEKSHTCHAEFFDTFKNNSQSEYIPLDEREVEWLTKKGCPIKRISVPKGGMVLWDSRTVHAGAPAKRGRANPGRWRYVVFVCMAPAMWARPEDMVAKNDAYNNLKCTRHWPAYDVSSFRTKKEPFDVTELPDVAKTDLARLLAGDLEYDFSDGGPNGPEYKLQFKESK